LLKHFSKKKTFLPGHLTYKECNNMLAQISSHPYDITLRKKKYLKNNISKSRRKQFILTFELQEYIVFKHLILHLFKNVFQFTTQCYVMRSCFVLSKVCMVILYLNETKIWTSSMHYTIFASLVHLFNLLHYKTLLKHWKKREKSFWDFIFVMVITITVMIFR
jgi:hypothetical protein